MIHLDTTYLVDLLREAARQETGAATRKLDDLAEDALAVSLYVACELQAGAQLSRNPSVERTRVDALLGSLEIVLPDERLPHHYGGLLAELRRRGEPYRRWTFSSPRRPSPTARRF